MVALAVVFGAVSGCAAATSASVVDQADITSKIGSAVEARIAQIGAPGAIVSLSIPGEVDYVKAFGTGDTAAGTPMRVDDHFRIGSVTKTFTGTAILQLVEEGQVRLSDPISRYVDGVPRGDEITLDMLGRMRSGLPDYTETETLFTTMYSEATSSPTAFAFTPRQLIDMAFERPADFAPNERFAYNNTNTVLLGMVVEDVADMPLADFLQQRIFEPADLTETSLPGDGRMPSPYAHGYHKSADGVTYDSALWNVSWANAAGAAVSTVADMRSWLSVLGKGASLQPETHTQRLSDGSPVADGANYAFAIFDVQGWIGHNGSIPGYTTVAVYLPSRDASLVVTVNSDASEPHAAGQIANIVTSIVTPENVYGIGPQPPVEIDGEG